MEWSTWWMDWFTWWMDSPHMSPCILFKKTCDSDMTLVKDGLTINLPCEQAAHEYSLGKRIFWFLSGCPCECLIIRHIIEDLG